MASMHCIPTARDMIFTAEVSLMVVLRGLEKISTLPTPVVLVRFSFVYLTLSGCEGKVIRRRQFQRTSYRKQEPHCKQHFFEHVTDSYFQVSLLLIFRLSFDWAVFYSASIVPGPTSCPRGHLPGFKELT